MVCSCAIQDPQCHKPVDYPPRLCFFSITIEAIIGLGVSVEYAVSGAGNRRKVGGKIETSLQVGPSRYSLPASFKVLPRIVEGDRERLGDTHLFCTISKV